MCEILKIYFYNAMKSCLDLEINLKYVLTITIKRNIQQKIILKADKFSYFKTFPPVGEDFEIQQIYYFFKYKHKRQNYFYFRKRGCSTITRGKLIISEGFLI